MTTKMRELLSEIQRVGSPAPRLHRGELTPFHLSCSVEPAASWDPQTLEASLSVRLPKDLRDLWDLSGGLRLFVDQEYGQWGLIVWPPDVALQRTHREHAARPEEYRAGDLVVGEFLGDADLLLVRCASDALDFGRVMVAMPIDPRSEWEFPAASLGRFLARYVELEGSKFWE